MNKIEKFLARLTKKELIHVQSCILDILHNKLEHLNLKKLKGYQDFYRVRLGDIRIIFSKKEGIIKIITIERRDEGTYREF